MYRNTLDTTSVRRILLLALMFCCCAGLAHAAERELHWDGLDVQAHLNQDGVLDVIERHTMVFTGDWNGGERIFKVRPRQKLSLLSLERVDEKIGLLRPMREVAVPNQVDEFTWKDDHTIRWRSRLPSDPPFTGTPLTFVLHYQLSGILLKDDAMYRIDHDFAFPDRSGPITRFSLTLDFDPAWKPDVAIPPQYTAGPLAPGRGFVLNIPLHYSGAIPPAAIDTRQPPEVIAAVLILLGGFALIVLAFVIRERSLGRFDPMASSVDGVWIESNILVHPAEVVGAAWDGRIGTPEVVALIARMTAERKLASKVESKDSMQLSLLVDRAELNGHERALVDGLFFNHHTETSTKTFVSITRAEALIPQMSSSRNSKNR